MANIRYYIANQKPSGRLFNRWDLIALLLICATISTLGWGAMQMSTPYMVGESLPISLDPAYLPGYAIRTVLRMLIALILSLLFTFIFGTWAAKSARAEQIIIPMVDILQSVPVLSFLYIAVVGFIWLFPNNLLGPECASIFAIFTAQTWNITLGFYQSLRTVPYDLKEAADMFHLSGWQRFWRIEVPFSMSSLLWNMMMSMSASWFFVVVSEAISVSNQNIRLPGVGSYIALAIEQANILAVMYAIITMLVVILIYDQILFRPLMKWSEKFKFEQVPGERGYRSWVVTLMLRTKLLQAFAKSMSVLSDKFIHLPIFKSKPGFREEYTTQAQKTWRDWCWTFLVSGALLVSAVVLSRFILLSFDLHEVLRVAWLGTITATRVIVIIIISSVVWIPVGVWIGMRPRVAQTAQPIIQFLAAFPANLIYPLVVVAILRYDLNVEIWITPLMILGTQWYILFNVIAGASNIPKDIYQVADNLGVKGRLWWLRLGVPGIFPYFITGAITAAGGAWNASIVAEYVRWGAVTLKATGLGEYITQYTESGDFERVVLGTVMMCLFVLLFNRFFWRPLYRLAENRFMIH